MIKEEELKSGKREFSGGSANERKKIHQLSLSMSDQIVPGSEVLEGRVSALKGIKSYSREEEEMETLVTHIQELLNKKPVWLKTSLETELAAKGIKYSSDFTLKKALAALTYLFKNGPWKFTYIKFGYDPRKNKQSFAYQTFNVGIGNRNFLADTKGSRK